MVAGLDGGIKRLSNANMYLAAALFAFVLLAGPTSLALDGLLQNVGEYLQRLPSLALYSESFVDSDWQADWTLFYWRWWIAWSPRCCC